MNKQELYLKLVDILENEVGVHRHMLDTVRGEKDVLIAANIEAIAENNRAKELMITKLRALERGREAIIEQLLPQLGIDARPVKLLDVARKFDGEQAERLRTIHSALDLMINRIREYNQQNEALVQAALKTVEGSMDSLRKGLADNKVYKKKGQSGEVQVKAASGQFISKEV
jgi:flagellar biosynthesis/type III secretory pathway chaperone